MVSLASGKRINRSASRRGTKYAKPRRAGDGRPIGAGGAAAAANERGLITQRTRAGAWYSRAQRVTGGEVGA